MNPFGIMYNPHSIFKSVEFILQNKTYTAADISRNGDLYFSYDHHSSFSDVQPDACLDKINSSIREANEFFNRATVIFITLGTSFVYERTVDGKIVANCHKLPAIAYRKRLLKKEEIMKAFEQVYAFFPPGVQIIFTVSPVRHWRDGATENTRSKAILLTAIHEIVEQYAQCHYFPAYELMIDDLRDYRFYASDMLHPNELAVAYIWERFRETYFSKETNQALQEWNDLRQAMEHRPLFPESETYKKFLRDLELKKAAFHGKYPFIYI
jgi:hypothetical protein